MTHAQLAELAGASRGQSHGDPEWQISTGDVTDLLLRILPHWVSACAQVPTGRLMVVINQQLWRRQGVRSSSCRSSSSTRHRLRHGERHRHRAKSESPARLQSADNIGRRRSGLRGPDRIKGRLRRYDASEVLEPAVTGSQATTVVVPIRAQTYRLDPGRCAAEARQVEARQPRQHGSEIMQLVQANDQATSTVCPNLRGDDEHRLQPGDGSRSARHPPRSDSLAAIFDPAMSFEARRMRDHLADAPATCSSSSVHLLGLDATATAEDLAGGG